MAAAPQKAIKTMLLYSDVERIDNELRELGVKEGGPLTMEQLSVLDSMHYEGTSAVDAMIEGLQVGNRSLVCDVGSGYGGQARYITQKTGAQLTAIELQPDMHKKAAELTQRCGLSL